MPSRQEKDISSVTSSFLRNKRSSNCSKSCRKIDKVELPRVEVKKPALDHSILNPDETEFENMINHIDRELSDTDSMWLSSNSTSTFLNLKSLDPSESNVLDHFLSEKLSSISSFCENCCEDSDEDNNILSSDNSNVSRIDSTVVLDTQCQDTNGNLNDECGQAANTIQLEDNASSIIRSESGRFSSECSYSVCSSTSTIPATPSYEDWLAKSFDRTNIWVSSLDLDAEDSQLTPNEKQGFDFRDFEFPSPFKFMAMRDLENRSSVSCCSISTGQKGNIKAVVKEVDPDEPLFWPFDENSYKNLDFEKFLSLSPRRGGKSSGIPAFRGSKSVKSTLPKNIKSKKSKEAIEGVRRMIDFNATPNLAAPPSKRVGYGCGVQRIVATPPRLSKAARVTTCQNPGSILKKKGVLKSKANTQKKITTNDLSSQNQEELELGLVRGASIEKIVGLNEFVGYEGIDD